MAGVGITVGIITMNENTMAIANIEATDDTDSVDSGLTFSLSGTDASLFEANSDVGELSFMAAPDYENPQDENGDNCYELVVTVTDAKVRSRFPSVIC